MSEIKSEYIVINGQRYLITKPGGVTANDGEDAGAVIAKFEGKPSMTRTANAVGTSAKEMKWADGDNVRSVLIGAFWTAGVTVTGAQRLLACFDCNAAARALLIGADGTTTVPELLDANNNCYMIPVNSFLLVSFEGALSYDSNVGFLGNGWVRSIDGTNTLDAIIMGAS